jgi:hypothetical protein
MYHLKVGCFLLGENLKIDGSNFPRWYQRLRNILLHNDLFYVIKQPLDETPGLDATAQDREEYHEAHDIVIRVQTLMLSSMEPHLKAHYDHHDPYSMINALRSHFAPQVRKKKYDCLNEFFAKDGGKHVH